MKIFYGVQGTGNGHISRARAMNKYLQQQPVHVDYFFSGRNKDDYFGMEEFGDWRCAGGLTFAHKNGKISTLETLKNNNVLQFLKDIKQLNLRSYDLVIHDFEPITAWAAKLQGVESISLGHQYAFNYDIPLEGDSVATRTLIRHFAPADTRIGLHWHHFNQPILPPIVDLDESLHVEPKDFVLVYLGFEAPQEVLNLLHQSPDTHFVYYGKFEQASENKNVSLRPLSVDGFKRDLHRCSGVICNAGFELASEALQLSKKLLVKPLHGQMEQLSNALALTQLGLGWRMETLDSSIVNNWIEKASTPQCHYPNVAKHIVEWLLTENRSSVEDLSARLWQRTSFGEQQETMPSGTATSLLASS